MQADLSPVPAWQQQRRRLLAAAVAGVPSVALARGPSESAHPRDVGRKFNADGTPMPFEGNTFAGHLVQQGEGYETFDAWLDIVREMPRHGFARMLTLLPTSSWHVTLIGGVNDADRQTSAWPSDLPRDMPIADVHRVLLQRLKRRTTRPPGPCSFVVDDSHPPSLHREGSLAIPLRPADAGTAERLRTARDELAELLRLRRPDHHSYRFHVTIGYLCRFLDDAESAAMRAAAADWRLRLAARGPLVIGAFHFCVLRDMFAYRELRIV
jgi:hypothetical protein